jgi:hypothetical protein
MGKDAACSALPRGFEQGHQGDEGGTQEAEGTGRVVFVQTQDPRSHPKSLRMAETTLNPRGESPANSQFDCLIYSDLFVPQAG